MPNSFEIEFPTGNFLNKITMEPADEVLLELAKAGAQRIFQNDVLPVWEKSFWPVNARGNRERPSKEWKRKDIPFNAENAAGLEKLLGLATIEMPKGEGETTARKLSLGQMDVSITEYIATVYVPKYAAQKTHVSWYLFQPDGVTPKTLAVGGNRSIASFCASRGIEVPSEPWEEDTDFLGAVKNWMDEEERKAADKE